MWVLVSEYLLTKSNVLEIKNFGKFTSTNIDAIIDLTNKTLKPKEKKISFIPKSSHTSPEFIEFVSKTLKRKKDNVEKLINSHIIEAKEKLKKSEKIELPYIGYFYKDNDNINFKQTAKFSLDTENFGNPGIILPNIIEKQHKKTTEPIRTSQKPQKHTKKVKHKKTISFSWTQTLKYSIIFIAIVAVITVIWVLPLNIGKNFIQSISTTEKQKQKQQIVKTTQAEQINNTKQTQPQKTTQNQQNLTVQTEATKPDSLILAKINIKVYFPIPQGDKKYYLIVGSFIKKENAIKFKQELMQKGYSVLILSYGENRHRVSIGGFDDPHQVIKVYDDYLNRFPDKGIWLLINKNK